MLRSLLSSAYGIASFLAKTKASSPEKSLVPNSRKQILMDICLSSNFPIKSHSKKVDFKAFFFGLL